jgi:hypothetical protein
MGFGFLGVNLISWLIMAAVFKNFMGYNLLGYSNILV